MIRGTTIFKCNDCGKVFKAPDIEYLATVYSCPQPCPSCGSDHSYPVFQRFRKRAYVGIGNHETKEQ